jgi:hypothetical protein
MARISPLKRQAVPPDRAGSTPAWGYIRAQIITLDQGASLDLPALAERFVIVSGCVSLSGPSGSTRMAIAGQLAPSSACVELPTGHAWSLLALSPARLVLYSQSREPRKDHP